MKQLLRELYGTFSARTRWRLRLALVGLLVVAALEMLGLVLILPLMQMLTNPDERTGLLLRVAHALGDPSDSTLMTILAGVAVSAFVAKAIFALAFRWWMLGFTNREAVDTSVDLFGRYLHGPYSLHLARNTSEFLGTQATAVKQVYLSVVNGILAAASEIASMLGILTVLLVARPLPAFGALVYFGLVGYVFQRIVRSKSTHAGNELLDAAMASDKAALQGLGAIKSIQVRNIQEFFIDTYRNERRREAEATRMVLYLGEAPKYVIEMLFIVGVAILSVITFSGHSASSGAATLGLFVAAGFRMLPSMVRALAAISSVRVGEKGLSLVLGDLRSLPPTPVAGVERRARPLVLRDRILLEDLTFQYPGSEIDVLKGINLTLPVGTSLAIVGASGAGKTTLVDVILGLHTPTSGRVLIDGSPMDSVKAEWQRSIGLVPQDVYLLDTSLRENIALGDQPDEIDDSRMYEAIERAQLDELVQAMPNGVETYLGDRGVRISGGQRQRVGIARALYLRPQLLVLDEATSSLDNVTEHRITATIDSLHGDLTMIVVAHRLSTVRHCDQLIFMRDGRIETQGTFAEVCARNATFARLVELGSLDELEDAAKANPMKPAAAGADDQVTT